MHYFGIKTIQYIVHNLVNICCATLFEHINHYYKSGAIEPNHHIDNPLKADEVTFNQTSKIESHDFKIQTINHHLQIPEVPLCYQNRIIMVGGASKPVGIPNFH
jgi:hypothetical protein